MGIAEASAVGILDGGQIALALAAAPSTSGLVSVPTAVVLNTAVPGVGGEPGQVVTALGGGLDRLTEIVPAVLDDRDPGPFVEWILDQDDYARTTPATRHIVRAMLHRNAFSGLLTRPAPGGDELASRVGVVGARVLLLRTGSRGPVVAELDHALEQLLPHARRETLPAATSHLPLDDAPEVLAGRIIEHVGPGVA